MKRRSFLKHSFALAASGSVFLSSTAAWAAADAVKLVIVGDGGVGKTSALMSYAMNLFPGRTPPMQMDTRTVSTTVDGRRTALTLFDTIGQDAYDRLRPLSYPGTDVFIVAYSVSSPSSFGNVSGKWLPELAHHSRGVPILLAGLKTDLREGEKRPHHSFLATAQGSQLAHAHGLGFGECSALTQTGLKPLFDSAVRLARATKRNRYKLRNPLRMK